MDKNSNGQGNMTKGQERKLQRKKEIAAGKRKMVLTKVIIFLVIAVVCFLLGFFITRAIIKKNNTTKPNSDFSAELNDKGFINGINASDYVSTIDTSSLSIPKSEIELSEEELATRIESVVNGHKVLSDDAQLVINDGDEVNIDYVGSVDGVEFTGGSTGGQGDRRTIGAGTLIDDFEQQLIGSHPGDNVKVEVTFPDPYQNNPSLAGKDAVFDVTVNGIYVAPEFTDEFVKENLSQYASTADEYRNYLMETNYENNLNSYIQKYISDNTTANDYPSSYVKHLKGLFRFSDEAMYTSYNEMAYQGSGQYAFNNFSEFTQMTDEEYEDYIEERAKNQARLDVAYQLLFEKAGLSISDDEYADFIKDEAEDDVASFGKPYFMKRLLTTKVLEYFEEIAVIE